MKKTFLKKLLAPIGKGLIVFGVFGLALYTYAVGFPASQPAPVTGVVGMYAGLTTAHTGSSGGYESVQGYCDTAAAGSHVCTAMEIINTYNNNPSVIPAGAGMAWINNGPPGYVENLSNDCAGWTSPSGAIYGSVINIDRGGTFVDDSFYIQPCSASYKFACCK